MSTARWVPRVVLRIWLRRALKRHGLVAIRTDEVDRLCADAAVLLIAEVEAELAQVAN